MTIVLLIILVAMIVIVAVAVRSARSRARRAEDDRTLEASGGLRAAEVEPVERERGLGDLDLRPLSEDARIDYLEHWRVAPALFVDDPAGSIDEADLLIQSVMRERGYSYRNGDFDARIGDFHQAVDRYRDVHDVAIRARVGDASTEELHGALTSYGVLFHELVTTNTAHEVR